MPSSVIKKISYNDEHHTLFVEYVSGLIYAYLEVPEKVYQHLKAAPSKGRYLNFHIKGKYAYKLVVGQ